MSKKRLIDADALIEKFKIIASVPWNHKVSPVSWADAYEKIAEGDIEDAPTIDAVEVVHGRWIVDRERMSAECSECGKGLNFSDEMQIDLLGRMERYCYYCGAKMDGE